jgi:hypothetical protein
MAPTIVVLFRDNHESPTDVGMERIANPNLKL